MSLQHKALSTLVDYLLQQDDFDTMLLDEPRLLPDFQDSLRDMLLERTDKLVGTEAAGRLLAIAYTGQSHLEWTLLDGVTVGAIAAALRIPELESVESISLCIDTISGSMSQLASVLSGLPHLRELCLLCDPARTSDELSTQLYIDMSQDLKQFTSMGAKIVLAGAYSSSMGRNIWLPTVNYQPPIQRFPVVHMFVRHQLSDTTPERSWPCIYYFGDTMLQAEHFAAGFLLYLRGIGASSLDEHLYAFASAPSTLEDFTLDMSRSATVPIPAENFTIYPRPPMNHNEPGSAVESWPKTRNLVPGSWVVLVSREIYLDQAALRSSERGVDGLHLPFNALTLRYAFVRVARDAAPVTVGGVPHRFQPDQLDIIGGIKEFLSATLSPGCIDEAKIDNLLADLEQHMEGLPRQVSLPHDVQRLAILDSEKACQMLTDFMDHSVTVRKSLRQIRKDDPPPHLPFFESES
jgi:hypothetical protein